MKISRLLIIFILTIIVNIAIAARIHATTMKATTITFILQEFEELSGEDFSSKELSYFMDSNVKDPRIAILKAFFRRHESPLYEHADYIVKLSDEYRLDYRLIPAIAMQESTACKFIPKDSYNCWGWGIYGNTVTRFGSYPDAIETIAKGLKVDYIDRGLTTPQEIMAKYTPGSNGSWARGVTNVLGVLE